MNKKNEKIRMYQITIGLFRSTTVAQNIQDALTKFLIKSHNKTKPNILDVDKIELIGETDD